MPAAPGGPPVREAPSICALPAIPTAALATSFTLPPSRIAMDTTLGFALGDAAKGRGRFRLGTLLLVSRAPSIHVRRLRGISDLPYARFHRTATASGLTTTYLFGRH